MLPYFSHNVQHEPRQMTNHFYARMQEAQMHSTSLCQQCNGGHAAVPADMLVLLHTAFCNLTTPHEAFCRKRRCIACLHVSSAMEDMRQYQLMRKTTAEAEKKDAVADANANDDGMTCPVDSMDTQGALAQRQLLCLLEVS